MIDVTIGVVTGGMFVVMFAVTLLAMLSLLAVLESAVRTHWPQARRRLHLHRRTAHV